MPLARRLRRTSLWLAACAAMAASTGCLRSSPVRVPSGDLPATAAANPASAAPTPPAALNLPAELLHDDSISRTSTQPAAAPPPSSRDYSQPLSPPPPPALKPLAPDPNDDAPGPTTPPATPLLDAAIKRVEAIQEIQRQSLLSEPADPEPKPPTPAPVRVASNPKPAPVSAQTEPTDNPDLVPAPPMPPLSAGPAAKNSAPASPSPKPDDTAPTPATPWFPLPDLAACLATETPAKLAAIIPKDAKNRPNTPDEDHADPQDLRIAEFQLCRHISGFGAFERLPDHALRLGQQTLIYCEMTGLRYEPRGDGFHSKMSSRVELRKQDSGKIAWAQDLGSAEENSRRVRRDYYVSGCIEFPHTLEPGRYHLRLIQTDEISHQTTSADLPVTLRP